MCGWSQCFDGRSNLLAVRHRDALSLEVLNDGSQLLPAYRLFFRV